MIASELVTAMEQSCIMVKHSASRRHPAESMIWQSVSQSFATVLVEMKVRPLFPSGATPHKSRFVTLHAVKPGLTNDAPGMSRKEPPCVTGQGREAGVSGVAIRPFPFWHLCRQRPRILDQTLSSQDVAPRYRGEPVFSRFHKKDGNAAVRGTLAQARSAPALRRRPEPHAFLNQQASALPHPALSQT